MLTRREALKGIAAVPIAASMPTATVALPATEPVAPLLAWAFDIRYGDYRDTVIAATKDEAHARMIAEHFDGDLADDCPRRILGSEDECAIEDCQCTDCGLSSVDREPRLDCAASRGEITMDDYRSAGWGMVCNRCGGEPMGGDWEVVDCDPVCNDCMTIKDWQAVNPKYAAELLEEQRIEAMTDDEFRSRKIDLFDAANQAVKD